MVNNCQIWNEIFGEIIMKDEQVFSSRKIVPIISYFSHNFVLHYNWLVVHEKFLGRELFEKNN